MNNKVILNDKDKTLLESKFKEVLAQHKAMDNLTHWIDRLGNKKAAQYQLFGNTVDRVLYSMTHSYNEVLHTHTKEHTAECEHTSIHYGVTVGGVYKKEPVLRKNYRDVCAAYIRYLRAVFSVNDIK